MPDGDVGIGVGIGIGIGVGGRGKACVDLYNHLKKGLCRKLRDGVTRERED